MQKLMLTFILSLTCYLCFSQTETIRKSDRQFPIPGNDFAFIEPATDTTNLEFVATIKATGKANGSVQDAYFTIREQATKTGANCFRLSSYTRNDSLHTVTLVLDTYFGNDSVLNANFGRHEESAVFVIGDDNPAEGKTYTFKVNGNKKTINSGTYFKQIIKEGETIKINKGGISGMTIWFKYTPGKKATFLTLTGVGLGGGAVPGDIVGVAVNTGRLHHIPGDLGCLLKNILKQNE
jgi:hypothetical protein